MPFGTGRRANASVGGPDGRRDTVRPCRSPSPESPASPRSNPARTSPAAIMELAELADGDIVVVTSKIVSKAEGRTVELDTVTPSAFAEQWAVVWDKDPRVVEIVLRESKRVVRQVGPVLITETHHGFVAPTPVSTSRPAGRQGGWCCCRSIPMVRRGDAGPIRRARRRRGGHHQRHVREGVARGADRRRDRRRRDGPARRATSARSTRTATSSGFRSCASPTSWPAPPSW